MSKAEFSLAQLTLLELPVTGFIDIAQQAGYDFVGLRLIPVGAPGENWFDLGHDRALLQQTRAHLKATGMRLLDIEVARIAADTDVADYRPALEAGAELGARHVITSGWIADRTRVLEQFTALCEMAKPLNLTVDFEFVSFAAYSSLTLAADIVRAAGCANGGICLDTLHYHRSGGSLQQIAALPAAWFRFAQLSDAPATFAPDIEAQKIVAREARLPLGEGGIDNASIVKTLPDMTYAVEVPNYQLRRALGDLAFAQRCLQGAKRCVAQARAAKTT